MSESEPPRTWPRCGGSTATAGSTARPGAGPDRDVPPLARRHGRGGPARAQRDGGRRPSRARAGRRRGWCCSRASTSGASCSTPTTAPARAQEIEANPAVSLLFPWHDLQRQVRVEGTASRVSEQESEAYFAGRPRGSQLGAWASPQSQEVVVAGRARREVPRREARFAGRTTCRCRRTGAASASGPTWWSSGRAARAGCTTGSSTAARGQGWALRGWPLTCLSAHVKAQPVSVSSPSSLVLLPLWSLSSSSP